MTSTARDAQPLYPASPRCISAPFHLFRLRLHEDIPRRAVGSVTCSCGDRAGASHPGDGRADARPLFACVPDRGGASHSHAYMFVGPGPVYVAMSTT
eukprot:scaffold52601_cov32-Tisochrysis_lutea.AAC.1